jgi:hypothetical protein
MGVDTNLSVLPGGRTGEEKGERVLESGVYLLGDRRCSAMRSSSSGRIYLVSLTRSAFI